MTTELVTVQASPLAKPEEVKAQLSALCANETAKRSIMLDYIRTNFKEGVDFGPSDPRSNKKTLLKAGAEKVALLFQARPVWRRDNDTWEMLGKPEGTVCFICEIVTRDGMILGEGRGSEKVGNKSRDANKTIKNAEKCALVDAALYAFGLSELFTQDLDREAERLAGNDQDTDDTPAANTDKETLRKQVMQYINQQRKTDMEPLSASKLIVAAAGCLLKKNTIDTMIELDQVRAAILANEFDIETGVHIKTQGGVASE